MYIVSFSWQLQLSMVWDSEVGTPYFFLSSQNNSVRNTIHITCYSQCFKPMYCITLKLKQKRWEKKTWRDKSIEKAGDFYLKYEQSFWLGRSTKQNLGEKAWCILLSWGEDEMRVHHNPRTPEMLIVWRRRSQWGTPATTWNSGDLLWTRTCSHPESSMERTGYMEPNASFLALISEILEIQIIMNCCLYSSLAM